jgi:ABC-2 type transport system permease protein
MARVFLASFAQWQIAFRSQLTFYLRTNRFLGLLLFVAIVTGAGLAFQLHSGVAQITASSSDASAYLLSYLGSIGVVIVLVAAFLGGDALAIDFGTSSGYYMLVLPVKRIVLLAGRFAAAFTATFVIGLVYYAFAVGGAAYFYGAGAIPFATLGFSIGLAAVYALSALGVAFFFSSFFRSPAVGMIVTVLVLYLGFSIVTGVAEVAGFEPWFSLTYGADVVSQVFNTQFTHMNVLVATPQISITTYEPYWWEGVAIMLAYLVAFLGLSVTVYERKESKG